MFCGKSNQPRIAINANNTINLLFGKSIGLQSTSKTKKVTVDGKF